MRHSRPMLFRATSLSAAQSFTAKGVRRPHGNVISADGFKRGVVRSGTDYEVYEKGILGKHPTHNVFLVFIQCLIWDL